MSIPRRLSLPLIFLSLILLSRASLTAQASKVSSENKQTLWFIPHTHWEGAVFKTREEFLQMGLPNILRALNLLKRYPTYRFTLDQVAYVRPFLERYPDEE